VNYSPAVLLAVDGEPVLAAVKDTKLKFVVNTQWAVFLDTDKSQYYLLAGPRWLTAPDLHGPWSAATKLPKDMEKLPKDPQWADLKKVIPLPAQSSAPIPKVFYSTVPAEVILFNGKPVYAKIPQTQLLYATNTDSPFFLYSPTNEYYYLAAGRWFRSKDMQGKWTFASMDLPADFAKIPLSSPASAVLSSVPGTEEAKNAVLIAQIPTVMEIDPKSAAAQAKVSYSGDPQFAPIEGTSLYYATNTTDKVIKVGDVYYLCLQGVWFMSPKAQGPWTTASSIPQVIYTIPPSSPVYNVTYVTQDDDFEWNSAIQLHRRVYGSFCGGGSCRCRHLQWHGLLLSAVYLSPAVRISCLSPLPSALWLRLLLQHCERFLRSLCDSLRPLRLSNQSCGSGLIERRKVGIQDLDPEDDDHMLVFVDVCRSIKSRSVNHLLAPGGGHLKRLAPSDVSEILPLIDLWLIRDDRSAGFVEFARPAGILREGRGTRCQQECERCYK
jgi:hypothetical protein